MDEIIEVDDWKPFLKEYNSESNFTGAIKDKNSNIIYYFKNGFLHREGGPAIIWPGGNFYWYKNNKLHREDGPATKHSDGEVYWYLEGIRASPMEIFERLSDEEKEKAIWNLDQWK